MLLLNTVNQIIQLSLASLGAFMIVYATIPVLIRVAYHKELYDKPDGQRKLHSDYIPTLGGIAIFIAFTLSLSFSGFGNEIPGYPYVVGSLLALFFCGLKDDLVGLSPKKKLMVQFLSIISIMFGSGFLITNFGGVLGLNEIPYLLSCAITLFTAVVVINSFNLIDGIDGLAAGVGAIASACFTAVFYVSGMHAMAATSLLLSISLIGYLFHNFHPANIFMGDTGSLVVGFVLAILSINLVMLNDVPLFNQIFSGSAASLVVSFLALPLYDTLRVFIRRIRKGESPFSADSDHIHHALLKIGWGQKRTVIYLYFAASLIVLVGFLTTYIDINISLGCILICCFLVFPTNGWKRKLAFKLGLDVEAILKPKNKVDLYEHLEITNRKKEFEKKSRSEVLD